MAPAVDSAPAATLVAEVPHGDACKRGIPDCEAACALRETGRTDYVDWYDRRCAAVILGKNPDGVPQASAGPSAAIPPRSDDLAPNPYR
jgi:hypothetical protein